MNFHCFAKEALPQVHLGCIWISTQPSDYRQITDHSISKRHRIKTRKQSILRVRGMDLGPTFSQQPSVWPMADSSHVRL